MAVFGAQLIYTIIMFVLLTKLGKYYSFGRHILCYKLYRYLSPGSDELKKAVRNHYKNANGKNKKLNRIFEIDDDKEEFNIPEGATVELTMSPVQPYDLYYIKYADDFQSFIDVSLIALIIYITTEIYTAFFRPEDEINLSVVWCGMVVLYGLATLTSIAINYLRTEEAALLYVFAGLSFLLSLFVQFADTKFFEFNLKDAYRNFTTNSLSMLQLHIESSGLNITISEQTATPKHATTTQKIYSQIKTYSTNELLFTCSLATLSAFIGALLFFPSFRLARLHVLCLKYSQDSKVKRFLFYLNFLLPLAVSLCWFRSGRAQISPSNSTNTTTNQTDTAKLFLSYIIKESSNATNQSATALMIKEYTHTVASFILNIILANNLRIYLIIAVFVLRLTLYRHYAQSYLNLAYELALNLRQRSTRITNTKYITTISSIYQYYGVVASQYVVPLFVLLFMMLLLKTLGDFSWCGDSVLCNNFVDSIANYTSSLKSNISSTPTIFKQFETSHFNMTLGHNVLNNIFTASVLRSVFGYLTFWICTIWFTISCFGLLYYNYIDRRVVLQ